MEFSSTPEEREEALHDCLEVILADYNEMVELVARSPLLLEEANIALRGLTAQLVRFNLIFVRLIFLIFFLISLVSCHLLVTTVTRSRVQSQSRLSTIVIASVLIVLSTIFLLFMILCLCMFESGSGLPTISTGMCTSFRYLYYLLISILKIS